MRTIPVFPLNLVVFPNSRYPLHIFEERYKIMINRCLETETGFGIVAPLGNELAKIGSYVIIPQVLKKYENGEMDIIVEAKNRFSIKRIFTHPDGYITSEVEDYFDIQPVANPALLVELEGRFEKILEKYDFKLEESFWAHYQIAKLKSFKIAEKSGLSLIEQQALLTLQDENHRINFLINHFEKLSEEISKNAGLRNIILGDGFLN
ncbi:MAG: LON peptidase substrate-binding domain-containing protein [Ignavibacteriaceae bacterium]|nr:LON peptidase substrate-binding domain-containing protein [Ignavibacteriaceae bacterium]